MRIRNPKNIQLSADDVRMIEEVEELSGLTDDQLSTIYVTSGFRPGDAFGYHKMGLAVDLSCQHLPTQRALYEGLRAAKWRGGLGIAGPKIPLHVHVDRRHEKGFPTAYFIEWWVSPQSTIYPTEQRDPTFYQSCLETVRRHYG